MSQETNSQKEIIIPRVREVNHLNYNRNVIALVAEAAVERIALQNGGSTETLMPTGRKLIDSITRALEYLRDGVPFSAYADYGGVLQTFTIASGSRPRLYNVTATACQCESHFHNGYCVHRTVWGLFNDYFKLVRADENRARVYAELGIEFVEEVSVASPTLTEGYATAGASKDPRTAIPEDVLKAVKEMFPGFIIEDIRLLPLGVEGMGGAIVTHRRG